MKRVKISTGSGCLTVFGGVFVLIGLAAAALAARTAWSALEARNWQAVEATVLSAALETNSDSDGGTTYRASGRYRYQWNGRDYESERIASTPGSDNIGSFHQDAHSVLERHRQTGEPITVWVDPNDPASALVFPQLRWGHFGLTLLFALVFGGVGAGIIAAARHGSALARREAARAERFPEQPWLWRDIWQGSVIKSQQKTRLWTAVSFAALWNLISAPVVFLVPGEILRKGNWPALIALLFPLVGAGLIVYAIRTWQQFRRFGQSSFEMKPVPARTGGRLAGMLAGRGTLPAGSELEVTLSCVRKEASGSGDDRRSRERVLWQDEQRLALPAGSAHTGIRVPVEFSLPADMPPSDWSDPDRVALWRLTVRSEVPGVDYEANFELPVFAPQEAGGGEPRAAATTQAPAVDPGDWQRTGVAAGMTAEGQRYYFGPARHKGAASMMSFVGLVFGAAGAGIVNAGSVIFGGLFLLFGLLLGAAAMHLWSHRSEIVTTSRQIKFRQGWLRLGSSTTIARDRIRRLTMPSNLSVGNKRYYDVVLHTVDDQRIKLAHSLPGNRDTRSLVVRIGRELGLNPHQLPG